MINMDDDNDRILSDIIQKIAVDMEQRAGLVEMKDVILYQARLSRMIYDIYRSQGFSSEQAMDFSINMTLTMFENVLKSNGED